MARGGEGHKGKRRKLNLEIEIKDGKFEEQLLQDVLDIIDRTKPADFKESPQKMISGIKYCSIFIPYKFKDLILINLIILRGFDDRYSFANLFC